jgi:geranylgeranyl pyrophosphate synthase
VQSITKEVPQIQLDDADATAGIFAPIQDSLALVQMRLQDVPAGQHDLVTAAAARLFSAGGKRLRPAICLLTAGIFDADLDHSVSLAAAVEMLHTATLVHDDLIDQSALRRGIATLNADWSPAATVLMGDYLFARAANLVARTKDVRVMELFADTLMVILNGEVKQQLAQGETSREAYYERTYAKTAAMFVLSTQAAALLGGADDRGLCALEAYGRSVGMAFQIVDDVLDFVGNPETIGKPVGSDLRQGLFTLPAIYYVESQPDDPTLRTLLEKGARDPDLVARLVVAVCESGAIDEALKEARELAGQAQRALESLPYSDYLAALSSLAQYVVDRDL